jgi:6-phosphogluconate dehydrogenase
MVPAGDPVDAVLAELRDVLDAGDVIIEGGNSHPRDTGRRADLLTAAGIHLVGAGISGGESGAVSGPSIMAGADPAAWALAGDLLTAIAAIDPDGVPCCDRIGPGGAGHLTKMVHNGIEYALMQAIAEVVALLRAGGAAPGDVAAILRSWQGSPADGYLLRITADVLTTPDSDGSPLVDSVLDAAAMKGTGSWTVALSLDLGHPTPMITSSVQARSLSARLDARRTFTRGVEPVLFDPEDRHAQVGADDLRSALVAAMVVAFAEGLDLLDAAAQAEGWQADLARVAQRWRAGSIIETQLLGPISESCRDGGALGSLLVAPQVMALLDATSPGLRRAVTAAGLRGLPVPALAAAVGTVDGMRAVPGTASVIQAMRDRFGAHTYERHDRPRGERFHSTWQG